MEMKNNNAVVTDAIIEAIRGPKRAQSRNRVGRKRCTLLWMGEVLIEKVAFELDFD